MCFNQEFGSVGNKIEFQGKLKRKAEESGILAFTKGGLLQVGVE